MKPLAQLSRQLPDPATLEELANKLKQKYTVQDTPTQTTNRNFYDSFDWRLYSKDILCFEQHNRLYLTDLIGCELTPSLPLAGKKIRFHQELPVSALQEKIKPLLEMRALLLQSSFSQTTWQLRILNKDEKTVVMITCSERYEAGQQDKQNEQNEQQDEQPICSVRLQEVRGYEKWFQRVEQDLQEFGIPMPCTKEQELRIALAGKGRTPKDYTSKFSVMLKPEMDGLTATKAIYRDLLTTMQANEQGILDDLDSEFLHDFRVAIRRTRSGLSMLKKVMEPDITARFAQDFRHLGKITGPVRDLDVYLLMEEDYKARLPEHLQKGLRYFFDDLAAQRTEEQAKLVKALRSSEYTTIINDWEEYLKKENNTEDTEGAEEATQPTEKPPKAAKRIDKIANTIIQKRFQRVLRDGQAITPDSPDESLHRLRIQGKKLRYSLEFFSSLYPSKEMKYLIKQLKNLQNNLGLFNDLSVQQDMLNAYLDELKPNSTKSQQISAAIGGLLTNLYHEQQQVRCEFEETFRCFSSGENISLYEKII
ncbi:MAG: CHAD domain-containing protein [Candidatus Electrothrix gigas]